MGPEQAADQRQALAWFVAEHQVLLAMIRQAGDDALAWQLAWTLNRFFGYQGHWHDSIEVLTVAMEAARRLADPLKEAFAHRFLGCAYIRLGRFGDADARLREALELYRAGADTVGEGHAHRHQAWLLERQGRYREALGHAEQALGLFRAAGHRPGQARALNAIGWFQAMLGDYAQAVAYCQQALDLQRDLDDRFGQAETWDSLGYASQRLGHHAAAISAYRTAAGLFRAFDDQYNEADSTASLGDAHYAAGDTAAAVTAWEQAAEILGQLGHPDAAKVRAKLASTRQPGGDRWPPAGLNRKNSSTRRLLNGHGRRDGHQKRHRRAARRDRGQQPARQGPAVRHRVGAMQAAAGEDESVTLGVDLVESSLPDTFAAAFEPDPAPTPRDAPDPAAS